MTNNVKEGLQVKNWEFRVDRCDSENKDECAVPDKIKEYVRDLEIQQWSVEERLNFQKFDAKPVDNFVFQKDAKLLNDDYYYSRNNLWEFHDISTQDDFWNFNSQ